MKMTSSTKPKALPTGFTLRSFAAVLLVSFLLEWFTPVALLALTSGPHQPEFASFEPVATTNMVSEFNGSLTYNLPVIDVPGPDGSGYSMSLSYHSGTTADEEASWVGYGWTLNAGSIQHQIRGIPDDARDEKVDYFNRTRTNETYAIGYNLGLQLFSKDFGVGVGYNKMMRYNNFTGFSVVSGYKVAIANLIDVGYNVEDGQGKFSATVTPAKFLQAAYSSSLRAKIGEKFKQGMQALSEGCQATAAARFNEAQSATSELSAVTTAGPGIAAVIDQHINSTFAVSPSAIESPEYTGESFDINFKFSPDFVPFVPGAIAPLSVGVNGSYSYSKGAGYKERSTYGYLYQHEVGLNAEPMQDYSIEREAPFTKRDRYLYIPYSGADVYSVNGDGPAGSFRAQNTLTPMLRPARSESSTGLYNVGLDFTAGPHLGVGFDLSGGDKSLTTSGIPGYAGVAFTKSSVQDAQYFRFTNDLGGYLSMTASDTPEAFNPYYTSSFSRVVNSNERVGRSTFVGYATNDQMTKVLSNGSRTKHYYSYSQEAGNSSNTRAEQYLDRTEAKIKDAVGEFALSGADGKRYVYGLPVYSRFEKSLQFDVAEYGTTSWDKQLVFNDNATEHHKDTKLNGSVRVTPHASQYLLTQITTPDYLDLSNDGPTSDDLGGYTAFEYRHSEATIAASTAKYAHGDYLSNHDNDKPAREWYKWRHPYRGLNYSPNKLLIRDDDRGSVSMGEKEVYYLKSIETKTHIAFFVTNKANLSYTNSNGQTVNLSGSGRERLDGYESYRGPVEIGAALTGPTSSETVYQSRVMDEDATVASNQYSTLTTYDGKWDNAYATRQTRAYRADHLDANTVRSVRKNKLEYLERIVIYAKDDLSQPVKTVNLSYTYDIMRTDASPTLADSSAYDSTMKIRRYTKLQMDSLVALPAYAHLVDYYWPAIGELNSAIGIVPVNAHVSSSFNSSNPLLRFRYGKLTLTKVWFDYSGTSNAKVAPYQFEYRYPNFNSYPASDSGMNDIKTKYPEITGHASGFYGNTDLGWYVGDENPVYERSCIDRWGFYQAVSHSISQEYYKDLTLPYVNQAPSSRFDPAAWQLKRIILPSGGEIQVQYEQNDYLYVQDKRAMIMTGLDSLGGQSMDGSDYVFKVNVSKYMGIRDAASTASLCTLCRNQFIDQKEKIHFKFLYNFGSCTGPTNYSTGTFPNDLVDYISGYCDVSSITADSSGSGPTAERYLKFKIGQGQTPADLASEYAKSMKVGNLGCNPKGEFGGAYTNQSVWTKLLEFMPSVAADLYTFFEMFTQPTYKPYYNFSFLRLPTLKAKKGGGIRVKRILMFDHGISSDNGSAVMYGTEYDYRNIDGTSSGVATSEPQSGREENALVQYLDKRESLSTFEKLKGEKDIEQFEGPIGENALPAPSVGYSRVVAKNIHSGKTGSGYTISEFYTARDYPMIAMSSTISTDLFEPDPVLQFLIHITQSKVSSTQGYSIITNSMHGKPKMTAKYKGDYSPGAIAQPIESQRYDYYKPGRYEQDAQGKVSYVEGEKLKVLNSYTGSIEEISLGKDAELVEESRKVEDNLYNHTFTFDAGIMFPSPFLLLPFPWFTFDYTFTQNTSTINIAVRNKVIQYPAITKSVTTYVNGVTHSEENLVFDKNSGTTVITKNNDEYDGLLLGSGATQAHQGSYLSYKIPASWVYAQMGQTASNEKFTCQVNLNTGSPNIVPPTGMTSMFSPGDEILVWNSSNTFVVHANSVDATKVGITPTSFCPTLVAGSGYQATIIHSARSNQLSSTVGGVTTYGSPTPKAPGNLTQADGVVSSSATTLSDSWDYGLSYASGLTPYEKGTKGKWRPLASYAYRTSVSSANTTGARVSSSGLYDSFDAFNYASPTSNSAKWVALSTVEKYSPGGSSTEERDVLGIYSSARFAHRGSVPSIVAKNAKSGAICFESFEDWTTGVSSQRAHTGRNSMLLTSSWALVDSLICDAQVSAEGALVRFWTSSRNPLPCSVQVNSSSYTPVRIAQSGDWKLYEVAVSSGLPSSGAVAVSFKNTLSDSCYIDDVRIQPLNASTTCYVYDKRNLRLIAQFDDQHFAALYQYNGEGKLVRNLRETTRGIKTVQEAQYNTPLITRSSLLVDSRTARGSAQGVGLVSGKSGEGPKQGSWYGVSAPAAPSDGFHSSSGKVNLIDVHITKDSAAIKLLKPDAKLPSKPSLPKIDGLDSSLIKQGLKATPMHQLQERAKSMKDSSAIIKD